MEQVGTEENCVFGAPSYESWFEMYPNLSEVRSHQSEREARGPDESVGDVGVSGNLCSEPKRCDEELGLLNHANAR